MATQIKIQVSQTEVEETPLPSLNYLASLSECMWEKATEVAGPGVAALFHSHADLEWIIDVIEGRRQPDSNPDGFHQEVARIIHQRWQLFGDGLAEAMVDYLVPGTPVYPAL